MIFVYSKEKGDQICIVTDSKPILVNTHRIAKDGLGCCCVEGCHHGHEYGYIFCREHRWILPLPAWKVPYGFQIGLIDYWKKQKKKKVIATHSYKRECVKV